MKLLYFIGGFALCYYLSKKTGGLPDIQVVQWSKERIVLMIDGKTYTLKIADAVRVGENIISYLQDGTLRIQTPGNTFNLNPAA